MMERNTYYITYIIELMKIDKNMKVIATKGTRYFCNQ